MAASPSPGRRSTSRRGPIPHTERIALEPDEVAIPGLTDAHLHLAQCAVVRHQVDLTGAATLEDGHASGSGPPTSA